VLQERGRPFIEVRAFAVLFGKGEENSHHARVPPAVDGFADQVLVLGAPRRGALLTPSIDILAGGSVLAVTRSLGAWVLAIFGCWLRLLRHCHPLIHKV
jgi:hypothetical protein